jgi:hypothetical protein
MVEVVEAEGAVAAAAEGVDKQANVLSLLNVL